MAIREQALGGWAGPLVPLHLLRPRRGLWSAGSRRLAFGFTAWGCGSSRGCAWPRPRERRRSHPRAPCSTGLARGHCVHNGCRAEPRPCLSREVSGDPPPTPQFALAVAGTTYSQASGRRPTLRPRDLRGMRRPRLRSAPAQSARRPAARRGLGGA